MQRIVFKNIDSTIGIIIPAPEWQGTIEELAQKDVPEGLEYKIVETSDIPTDRLFRDAWESDDTDASSQIAINMGKAKDICHEKRRAKRSELFAPLDIKVTIPSEAVQAEAERQIIRDNDAEVQINIDNASTPDELKIILDAYI